VIEGGCSGESGVFSTWIRQDRLDVKSSVAHRSFLPTIVDAEDEQKGSDRRDCAIALVLSITVGEYLVTVNVAFCKVNLLQPPMEQQAIIITLSGSHAASWWPLTVVVVVVVVLCNTGDGDDTVRGGLGLAVEKTGGEWWKRSPE
jgi:hypothetical protein